MPNRAYREAQDFARTERLPRLRLLRLVRTSSDADTKPVIAMRNGLDIQDGLSFKDWSLRELEAENAELRDTAIQLALEIQELRMGR